jgi:hypothetical protein
MSWIKDLADELATRGAGVVGESIFYGQMPDGEDVANPALSLSLLPGNVFFTAGVTGPAVKQSMFMLTSRATAWDDAWDKITTASGILEQVANRLIGTTQFLMVKSSSDIEDGQRDQYHRQVFTQNFEAWQ